MIIERGNSRYEVVVGVEIHAQLNTNSKLFSSGRNSFSDEPNSNVAYFDLGMPGMLPVLNKKCVTLAAMAGLGLRGEVQKFSRFDRKHYFYPDLPQGYQISQFYYPIVRGGYLEIVVGDSVKKIGIDRVHIEQDAGKLIHDRSPTESFVDYNRAGVPLIEVVSLPDLRSPQEAMDFLKEVRLVLRNVGASDADMEKGSFRCDANVSVREVGDPSFGTRCEIKNLNSFRFVGRAIEYEANRQVDILESGTKVDQQTRLFDVDAGKTFAMRDKEDSADYRYFPDPDLPPVVIGEGDIERIRLSMPEMHYNKRDRYIADYGLLLKEANDVISENAYVLLFEHLVQRHEPKFALGWVMTELVGLLKRTNVDLQSSCITGEALASLLDRIVDCTISGKIGKEVLAVMVETGKGPDEIIDEKGLRQVSDVGQLEEVVSSIIKQHSGEVEKYKSGNQRMMGFFVGQAMKLTGGKGNPDKINDIVKKLLG